MPHSRESRLQTQSNPLPCPPKTAFGCARGCYPVRNALTRALPAFLPSLRLWLRRSFGERAVSAADAGELLYNESFNQPKRTTHCIQPRPWYRRRPPLRQSFQLHHLTPCCRTSQHVIPPMTSASLCLRRAARPRSRSVNNWVTGPRA